MAGKLPIDRAREGQDAPKVYDEHRERFARHRADVREAEDPVSGGRPDPVLDDPLGEAGERASGADDPLLEPEAGLGPGEQDPAAGDPDGP